MAKEGESESRTKSQTGDPWSTGGDPWSNAQTDENKTHADNPVPESPMSQSFHAPKEKEEDVKTEEEDAKTDEKGQTVNEDTGARSSQDGSATEAKTDQEDKKDVKDETEVIEKNIYTPDKKTNRDRWPTPWPGTWWSSPLQDWYEGGRSARRGWWSQSQPTQSKWYWQTNGQHSWAAPSWWSTGTWEPETEKVATKVVRKDMGIVTDTPPAATKVTTKETAMATDVQTKADQGGQTDSRGPDTTSDRNRDYGAPPEFKGLDNLETYKRAVGRWKDRTGFKPPEQAGKTIDSLPMDLAKKINKLPEE